MAGAGLEGVAEARVLEPLISERTTGAGIVPLTLVPSVGPEDWDFVVTEGRMPPAGKHEGGRILLGSADYPDAGLLWTEEHGERYLHQVWVAPDLRGHRVATTLVDLYKEFVGGPVVWVGPFSPGGLRLAKATGEVRSGAFNPGLARKLTV